MSNQQYKYSGREGQIYFSLRFADQIEPDKYTIHQLWIKMCFLSLIITLN